MGKWLVSWTTYGTWLPGDKRGYCTWRGGVYVPPPKRYASPGEPTYVAAAHEQVRKLAESVCEEAVYFSDLEIKTVFREKRV